MKNNLLDSNSAHDFLNNFQQINQISIEEFIYHNTGILAQDIIVVGSLPQGSVTPVSDIDLLVTGEVVNTISSQLTLQQHNHGGGLLISEYFFDLNGVEVDVTHINHSSLESLCASLNLDSPHMSDLEIKLISSLKDSWTIYGTFSASDINFTNLTQYCFLRHLALALQEFEDAILAKDNKYFYISMITSSLFRLGSSLLTINGFCFTGPKWIKKAQKLKNRKLLIPDLEHLLFKIIDNFCFISKNNDRQEILLSVNSLFEEFFSLLSNKYLDYDISVKTNRSICNLINKNKGHLCQRMI